MSKPTLFFSHSSKDKEIVLAIKSKVMQYTSNTIEIFQSSDGESIPFGTNWIHKIEEGLNNATVMFVFVTENSISSGWIYFEAGYAYSKGIHVIPVGFGVNIGDLNAPLNLLQGFNITSADSLNNFLTIINREFNYDFASQFTPEDYDEITSLSSSHKKYNSQFSKIIRSVKYTLKGYYYDESEKKSRETKKIFDSIKTYLDDNKINYSLTKTHGYGYEKGSCIAVQGIKFTYELPESTETYGNLYVRISPYSFQKSFELYLELLKCCFNVENAWIQLRLNEGFNYKTSDVDCAALLMDSPELFSFSKSSVGFESQKHDLSFSIYNNKESRTNDYVLGIGYKLSTVKTENILELVDKLYDLQIIEKDYSRES